MRRDEKTGIDFTEHLSSDSRDYWWNADYLGLLKHRLGLEKAASVLEVGCGQGHWMSQISSIVPSKAQLIGIDQNKKWLDMARARFPGEVESGRFTFQTGDAYCLNFPDDHFDLVTCQTLLVHLDQPQKAVREMLRVLKKGGRLLLVEPNNLSQFIRANTAQEALTREETLDLILFYMLVEDGKKASGEGRLSAYDELAQIILDEGGNNVRLYTNDKAGYFAPPYKATEEKAKIGYILSMAEKDFFFIIPPESAERYFRAVSDDHALFQRLKAVSHKLNQAYIQQIKSGTLKGSLGCQMFIATGTK